MKYTWKVCLKQNKYFFHNGKYESGYVVMQNNQNMWWHAQSGQAVSARVPVTAPTLRTNWWAGFMWVTPETQRRVSVHVKTSPLCISQLSSVSFCTAGKNSRYDTERKKRRKNEGKMLHLSHPSSFCADCSSASTSGPLPPSLPPSPLTVRNWVYITYCSLKKRSTPMQTCFSKAAKPQHISIKQHLTFVVWTT